MLLSLTSFILHPSSFKAVQSKSELPSEYGIWSIGETLFPRIAKLE
jgi:hypothetical protein